MKKTTKSEFSVFLQGLTEEEQALIETFFSEFDLYFLLSKAERKLFRLDFRIALQSKHR